MNDLPKAAAVLPDIPRWMYARGLLLSGHCGLVGSWPEGPGGVVVATRWLLMCSLGDPDDATVHEAAAAARSEMEWLAAPGTAASLGRILPDWRFEWATLHTLSRDPGSERPESTTAPNVRLLNDDDYGRLEHVPPKLRGQLVLARRNGAAAAFVEEQPVSFCYAPILTETLWDVAVDTLTDHRRRGLAAESVRFMIRHMRSRGLAPVWGAAEGNIASLRMAETLGFRAVDNIAVFRRGR